MKRIIVWITVLTLIVTGVFAMNACGKRTDKDGISYQLNVSNFDGITTYGEPMDLSRITITRTENGVSTEVPVEASMVTSRVDTSKPGAHILKFNYSGQSFNLPVIVKYKLQFLVDGDVYKSIHVLNRAELGEVAHPEKPGCNFVGWSTEIPGVIADNMTFHAVYEPIIPTLSEIQATYGDNLAAINLPYSVIGQWKFDAPEGTVGNVGKHTFPVSFVEYATGAVLATDTLTVNVAKKTVVFSDVVESFVYNGAVQKPTFKTDVVPQEDEKFEIIFFETPGANYTDVGTYDYYFEVDADNYEGTLVGTYEIKHATITVKINSYEIIAGDAYPTVEYQLLGIGDADAEMVAQLIGLSVTQPEDIVAGAGVYTLTATASNPNVILNVQEGTLTVQSTVLDVADPIFEKEFAIYEDILADVLFKDNQNGNGTWSWKYPDALVGNVGIQEHIAVFTPYNTDKYDIIERTVQVKVEKKELIIEIVGKKEFDYNGQEHTLSYIIKDANGKQYASFTVLENPAYTNAGEYSITLKFEHQSYEASDVTEKLTIKKINPDTVFGKVDLTAVWNPNLTLAQITLPTSAMGQYTWVVEGNQTPGDIALSAGSKSYTAVFTPYDAYKTNYNSVSGEFTLQIEQATAKIEGVKDHYNFTYNKNAFVLEGITTNHTVSELAVEYKLNGQKVDSILNAGEYVVAFTLPETTNYKEAVVTATVTVAKADAGKPTVGTAAFGDLLLNAVKFPENSEGNWTILLDAGTNADENTKVGSVGEHKFVAVFTPTTENYKRSEVEITVNVAKKKIDVPQISGTNKSQVYTGALLNSGLISGEGYTVEDIGGTAVGTYKAKVVLDTTSYEWNDPNVQSTFDAEYRITPATNAWTAQPAINSWVYGQAGNNGTASAMLGDVTIEYKLASAADTAYTTARPTNAGAYIARFTVVYENYFDLVQTCAFTIEKQTVNAPEYTKNYIYNGSPITVDIPTSTLYNIANHINTDVREGGYLASLTLTDSANYQWSNSESATITLAYTIGKANIVISNFSIVGWTYGKLANAPTYDVTFKDYTEVTYEYFDKDYNSIGATAPRNAGTYYVKATAAGNTNLNGYTTDFAQFTIAKASVSIDGANDSYTETYNGVAFTITGVKASNGATVTKVITKKGVDGTVNAIIGVGEYTITYTVAEAPNYLGTERTVKVTIQQADVTISKPVIEGWTYGDGAKTPSAYFNETFAYGQIIFRYFTDADCKNEITDLTNAGTYYVKAVFAGNDDLKKAESEATAFVVAQKAVTVPTVSNKPYNGQNQTAGLTAAEGYTVVDNGGINVGSYKAVVTLVSDNYVWADGTSAAKELVYNITSIDNTQEFEKTSYTATYGDLLKDIIKLPANVQGTWSIEDATEATTVGNAGTRTFKAIFTPDEAGNYNDRIVEITIVVAKKTVEKPIINPKEYTGEHLYSGLTTNAIYTVVDNGGVDHDEYDVVLTLVDANNYKWEDTEDASITLKFVISTAVNAWVEGKLPTISSWEYESEGDHAGKATAMHGGVLIEYKLVTDPESAYSPELPSVPGDYIARFTTTDDNYNILTETKKFSITKRVITPPTQTQTSFVYSGSLIKSGLSDDTGYAVIADEGRTNVGSFTATISLTSEHYVWADGTSEDKTFTYNITPATNTEEITLAYNATYGDLLKDVITLPAGVQGTWSIENISNLDGITVGNAGTRTFKVIFTPDATGNYNGREETITIEVAKKSVPVPEVTKQEGIEYTGNKIASGLTDTELYTVTDIGGVAVGTHQVQLTLKDKANYKWQDGDSNDLYIDYAVIVKAQNRDAIPTYTATYGDSVATLTLPTSATGSWKWQTITEVGTVGGENKHVLVFTPSDTANYDTRTEEVTITVNPKKVTAPTGIPEANRNQVYTGEELFSGLTAGEGYTVTEATNPVNKGEYKVTVQLKNENYVWADGTSEAKTFTYNITPATNTQDITVEYTATYGDLLKDIITLPTGIQGTWSIEGATEATTVGNAGKQTFKAIFTPDEVGNYNRREETITITVAKKVVNVPTEYTKEYTYTGSDITVVIPVESGLYTVSGNIAKNFGSYNATLTLTDSANYKWATTDAATTTVPYGIGKADVAVSITINGWTYGQAANAPVVSISKEFVGDVPYIVEYSEDGIAWSTSVPTDAGSYTVRVTVEENANYQVTAESVTEATFTIAKISTSITANETYTFTYNGSAYTTQALNIPVPYTGAPALKYTYEDGSAFTGVTNAGEYKVVITLAETDTHKGATVTVTVKVDKANVTVSTPSIEDWTYNQTAKNPSAIVTYKDVNGNDITFEATLSFVYANSIDGEYNATVPTDAGIYYVKAVFAGNDNLNGAESEAQSFTIAKIVVPVPSIANKDYNGQVQYSGLVSDLYTVTEAENPLNKGEYTVTLTLNAPANYAWTSTDNTSATATATYSILPVENTISVNIGNNAQWQYGTAEDVVNGYITVDVKYGGWTVVYRVLGSTDDFTEGLPTKKGSYELKFTTTDTNCSIESATRSVEILATSVAVPTIGNLMYNATLQTPTVPAGLYTVVVNNGGTNVGEYTVTLRLLDADSSYWGTDTSDVADKVVTYQIVKADNVTISVPTIGNWNYNETASTPTATPSINVPYYFEYLVNGVWSTTVPTTAGNDYEVRAVVTETDQYNGYVSDGQKFAINKATPSLTGTPAFGGGNNGKYYLNQFTYSYSGMGAQHANVNVPGTFTWGAPTFVENGGGYIELTFTPTDTNNYNAIPATKYDINFVTVAVIGSTQYGSIESALAVAASGDTVRVSIHDADLGPIYIKENVEVKSGITLLLPYGDGENDKNTYTKNIPYYELHSGSCATGTHGTSEGLATEAQCALKVVVAADVVILNNGTIEVSGQLSGGGSPHPYAGHTGGAHARLLLDARAKIENHGVIRAAGYIRELNKNNGSQVNVYSGSTLYQPFVIMDYINGQYMAGAYKTMMNNAANPVNPFNRFALTNVSPTVRVEYGGAVITWAALYTSTMDSTKLDPKKANNVIDVTCIGTGGLVELSEGAYLTAKLDPDTLVTRLDVYNGAKTNPMKIKLSFAEAYGVDVGFSFTTDECWFPLTYLFDIELHNGKYTIDQDFKLMPGAKLTVAADAELIVNAKLIVYDQGTISSPSEQDGKFTDGRNGLVADGFLYPTTVGAAVFTVNGKATIQELGGEVHSQTPGATVIIKQGTYLEGHEAATYELGTLDGVVADLYVTLMESVAGTDKLSYDVAGRYIIKKNAVLVGTTANVTPSSPSTYRYVNGEWIPMLLSFDSNGGNSCGSIWMNDDVYPTLPLPIKEGATFLGWYYGDSDTPVVAGDTLSIFESHTLTAHWEVGVAVTLNPGEGATVEQSTVYFGSIARKYPTLYTPVKEGYTFKGWYTVSDPAAQNDSTLVTEGMAVSAGMGEHTLYAKWEVNSYTIKVTTSNATVKVNGTEVGNNSTISIVYGTQVTVEVTYSQSNSKTTTITGDNGTTYTSPFNMPAQGVTINASSSGGCFTPETLITLADGTQKRVDELTADDKILAWDFFTGTYVEKEISLLVNHGEDWYRIANLVFSDGTTLRVIAEHGVFDYDLNKYVYFTVDNMAEYIGHRFVQYAADGTYGIVTLVEAYETEEYTSAWSVSSAITSNAFASGLLTVAPPEDFYNWIEMDGKLMYNVEQFQQDVATYGLYTYEDFKDYVTYDQFIEWNGAYLKVAVEKGYFTFEYILELIELYKGWMPNN